MSEEMGQSDRELADELAQRLDAGLLTPKDDDSPELKALLATYSRGQEAVPEPDPALYEQIKESVMQETEHSAEEKTGDAGNAERKPPFWERQRWLVPAFYGLTILLVALGFGALLWVQSMPERVDDQQTFVVGGSQLVPGSEASLRVVVQDFGQGQPIEGALVRVSLDSPAGAPAPLFEGRTDETGSLPVQLQVPEDAPHEASLLVETESEVGTDALEQAVTIRRDYRLLLSSDKPLYQPGQTIHIRALALSDFDQTPARGATVNFLVEDAKGNKVFRQSVVASAYGIAAADFTLADLVNQGNYKLSASIESESGAPTEAEKTVEVRPYVLPKFGVSVSTDRSFYLPGQRVEGVVQADYFFGKPVTEGQVQITGSVWDVKRTQIVDLRGQTSETGAYAFAFDLPEYFAGSGLDSGQAEFALEVTVVDQTDHAEQTGLVLPIAEQPLIIEVVPESGSLKPGVENIIFILTSYPDGQPAPARLDITPSGGNTVSLETGEFGLAELPYTPGEAPVQAMEIAARDETGLYARRDVELAAEWEGDSVLLRAGRATYTVGETMDIVALTPVESGSIYLDIVKGGQTLSTRSARVEDGQAAFAVDASPDMYGTLELHAYKVLLDGTIVRDTRLVVVDEPNDIDIAVTADKETYLPGENATLDFATTAAGDPDAGVQTALGLALVDESVFALQRQDPGFAKLYFMLEQELMEPFYQAKGFEAYTETQTIDAPEPAAAGTAPGSAAPLLLAQDQAAKASWAGIPVLMVSNVSNSREVKTAAVQEAQQQGFSRIGGASAIGLILVPLLMFAVIIVAFWQAGVLPAAFWRFVAAVMVLIVASGIVACAFTGLVVALIFAELDAALIVLAALFGLALLAFALYAFIRRDPLARFLAVFTAVWIALLVLLVLSIQKGGSPSEPLVFAIIVAYLLIPGAYVLFGQGRWLQARKRVGGVGMGMGLLSAVPTLVLLVLVVALLVGCSAALEPGLNILDDGRQSMGVSEEPLSAGELPKVVGTNGFSGKGARAEPPRLRQYFPETLYWAPEVVTDRDGFVSLDIPMADSITTWRLTALASSQDGRLGYTTRGVRVFQDFFVDIDLPHSLTQGDEISVPVGVFNYLPEAQQVRLVVEPEDWFEVTGAGEQTLTIGANDIEVIYFPIRVDKFGRRGFQVTAWGERMSDAIRREVNVVPNGQAMDHTVSDWLRESKRLPVEVPAEAVPGATSVEVKIYPGVMAQAVEGLEKILRLPHG